MLRVRSAWTGTAPGLPFLTTHYFVGSTQTEADDAAIAVRAFWVALQGLITNVLTVQVEPEVAVMAPDTGNVTAVLAVTSAGVTGTNVQDPIPWTSQGLVRWSTGEFVNGRRVTGHTYIPGAGESSNSNGRVDSGYSGPVLTAANALISDADSQLLVWHRPQPTPAAANGSQHVVTGATVSQEWAVLRSRRQ